MQMTGLRSAKADSSNGLKYKQAVTDVSMLQGIYRRLGAKGSYLPL